MLNTVLIYIQMCIATLCYRLSALIVILMPMPCLASLYFYIQDPSIVNVCLFIFILLLTPFISILTNLLVIGSIKLDPFKNDNDATRK